MIDTVQNAVFGKILEHMNVIEFQKHSLPHVHVLLILDHSNKLSTKDDVDDIVSAKIPNPYTQERLVTVHHTFHHTWLLAQVFANGISSHLSQQNRSIMGFVQLTFI
jgi:hypothetical protein